MLTGCATAPSFDAVYTRISPMMVQAGDPLPQASAEPILTVTGKIQAVQTEADCEGNAPCSTTQPLPRSILMDETSLQSVGMVEYDVEDPFEGGTNTFKGVLFRDLLLLWQVEPDATQLTITALNDYEVQVPIALLKSYPVMLALQQNSQPMTRDYRGPAMLVAPHTQYPAVKELANQQYWVWQIATIHVE